MAPLRWAWDLVEPTRGQTERVSVPTSDLHQRVLGWYEVHARDLPWRDPDAGAWAVLVSEIMLQQTPVVRVLPVYRAWLERWPTPAALAADSVGDAVAFFGITERDLHDILCSCHHGDAMPASDAAERVRAVAARA